MGEGSEPVEYNRHGKVNLLYVVIIMITTIAITMLMKPFEGGRVAVIYEESKRMRGLLEIRWLTLC